MFFQFWPNKSRGLQLSDVILDALYNTANPISNTPPKLEAVFCVLCDSAKIHSIDRCIIGPNTFLESIPYAGLRIHAGTTVLLKKSV